MPRVTLTKSQSLNKNAILLYKHFVSEHNSSDIPKIMGYSRETHYNRKKHPEDFTLAQLRTLYKEAHLTDAEFMSMVRLEGDKNEARFC